MSNDLSPTAQKAVQRLLRDAKRNFRHWRVFMNSLEEDGIDEEEASIRSMIRNKSGKTTPGKIIRKPFALKLIVYCINNEIMTDSHRQDLGTDLVEEATRSAVGQVKVRIDRSKFFISALGLVGGVNTASVTFFQGKYVQFSLNEHSEVITTHCHLEDKLGADLAPVFSSHRMRNNVKRNFSGAYFFSEHNLYLIASPSDAVELRMSVFNAVETEPQLIRCGMILGVTNSRSIIGSRCVLLPLDDVDVAKALPELYPNPVPEHVFESIMPRPPHELGKVKPFLYGEVAFDFIKPVKLAVPKE